MTTLTTAMRARSNLLVPGLLMSCVVAAAATFLADHYHAPVMLFALLLGMAMNFLSVDGKCKPGIEFTAREVLRVSPATAPMQIALLVDTSQAIDNFLIDFRNGVQKFIKRMAGKNEIMLMGFGERPTQLVDFTRDGARLEKAMGSVFARQGSGTYLLEAIIDASRALRRHKAARPHIVVVAARGPEFSEHHHTNVVDAVREAGATLHTLMLQRRSGAAATNDREEQELQLTVDDGTRLSGGRRDDILTTMAIGDRMEALASELENQYQITYARPPQLIPPKTVEVSTKRTDVTVRAKQWP